MNLKKLSDIKLRKLADKLNLELSMRVQQAKHKEHIKQATNKFLKEHKITFAELFGKDTKKTVAPKWRHKEDSNLTWAGRGRQPKWIKKFGVKI
jgi:DNA-binding protein H-NS